MLRRLWRFDLTGGGRMLLAGIFFSGLAGCMTFLVPIYNTFVALVFLYLACYAVSLVLRPRIDLSGSFPEKAVAGQPLEVEFTVTNRTPVPTYDLSLGLFALPNALQSREPARTLLRLGGRQTRKIPLGLLPRRRGQYELGDLRAFSTFPLNVFRRMGTAQDMGSLLVLPTFWPLRRIDMPVAARYQPGGIAYSSHVGESPEYVSSREFRPGDSARRIDFRSWARLATPAVKEYQEEYYRRVALVLDTFVPGRRRAPPTGFPQLEAAVSLAAAAAHALSKGEYIIDLFAAGSRLHVFRAGRHTAQFENILEILACVDRCPKAPFDMLAPAVADQLAGLSALICVMLDWEQRRRGFVRAAAEADCRTKVIIVRDRPTTQPTEPDEGWAGPITLCRPQDVLAGKVLEI